MKRRIFSMLLIALMVVSLCSGCADKTVITSSDEQIEISLSWWGNDARHEYTIAAVKEFERIHPEIKVNCHYSDWSGYQQRSDAQMAANTEADVMQINYAWIQQYSPDGEEFYDINTLSDYIDLTNFSEEELNFGMQNGKLNAIPIALNTQTVYINQSVYESYGLEVPKTWDDFFHAAEVMNEETYPIAMTAKSLWFFSIAYAEQQTGKEFMTLDGELVFTPEDIQTMIDFYCRLIQENVVPQPEYYDSLKVSTGEYAGTVAWVSDAINHCGKAIENGYEMVVADYTVTDTAKVSDGWYAKPATMYAISKNTEYPKETAMLLDFLLNSDEMAKLQGLEKGVPVSKSARTHLEENDMLNGIQYEAFLKMNEYSEGIAVVSPYLENDTMIDEFRNSCNEVLFEKSNIEDKADALYDKLKEILAQAKEY